MNVNQSRLFYLFLTVITMCLGLLSRSLTTYIPDIVDLFLGDALWALMIYFMIKIVFIKLTPKKTAILGIIFCFTIEFSQLYHNLWIDSIRATTIGGLVLGYGFLWSDLVAYLIGIAIGVFIEIKVLRAIFILT